MAAGLFKPDTAHSMSHLTNCPKVSGSTPENIQLTKANMLYLKPNNVMNNGTPDRQTGSEF